MLAIAFGVGEILVMLVLLLLAGVAVAGITLLVIWLSKRTQPSAAAGQPVPPPARTCSQCGTPLAVDAPAGLCAQCLVRVGMGSEAETVPSPEDAPTSEPIKVVSATRPPPDPAEIARHFPQLEILALLGQGGMGVVYKARQARLDRLVALKVLPVDSARDPAFAERFSREARALARLNHPNIVAVFDFGETAGYYYFLMEYVDGVNLRQMERSGSLTPTEALTIVPKICEALQYAHDEGIIHRDIKPENILVDKKGRVKIADFGLAKLLGKAPTDYTLTGSQQMMGTPHYMAPEQMEKPLSVDHRADIYSLGVVFYEMLTGELPLGRFAPPSQKVQVDVRLDEVVLKTLEKEPDRRYQHASEVKTQVESISQSARRPRVRAAPASPTWLKALLITLAAGAGALVLAGILFFGLFFLRVGQHRQSLRQAAVAVERAPLPPAVANLKSFTPADPTISQDLVAEGDAWFMDAPEPQTFRLFEIANPDAQDCTVRYRAQLKTENLQGKAYLEMWCRVPGRGEAFSRGLDQTITGSTDWSSSEIPFYLKPGERPDLIRLNLVVEGTGRVGIRNVEVRKIAGGQRSR